jgi:tyrosine-protein kinase Etk/Wzc
VDGDFAGRGLEDIFGISHKMGLLEYFSGNQVETIPTGIENLMFLPAGTSTSGTHPFDSPKLKDIIDGFRKSFDAVFIDTAPILDKCDAVVLGQKASGVLLVFRAGNFIREDEITAREMLERSNVRMIGAIFNRIREEDQDPFYTYQRYLEKQEK